MDEHPVIVFVRSKVPDPGRAFTIIADLAALGAHLETPHFAAVGAALGAYVLS